MRVYFEGGLIEMKIIRLLFGVAVLLVLSLSSVCADYSLPVVYDSDKTEIGKRFCPSYHHNACAAEFGEALQGKAEVNHDYIKNIRKIAVLGFNINIWYEIDNRTPANRLSLNTSEKSMDSRYGFVDTDVTELTDSLYNLFSRAMAAEGFQAVPAKVITGLASYQSLSSYDEIAKIISLRKGKTHTALGLKHIEPAQVLNPSNSRTAEERRAAIQRNIGQFMNVAEEAGADTGVIVSLGFLLSWKGDRFGNLTSEYQIDLQSCPNSPGMTVDFLVRNPPRIGWSACLSNYNIPSKHQAEFRKTPYFMSSTIWYSLKLLQPEIEAEMYKIFSAVGYQLHSKM
jgi:hypothetical protein